MNLRKIQMIRTALLPWCRAFGCVVTRPVAVSASDVSMRPVIGTFDDAIVVLVGINLWANKGSRVTLHEAEL